MYNDVSPVQKRDLSAREKILTTTWAMKTKSNGQLQGRLNARGYKQRDGEQYFANLIAAPVTNANKIQTILMLYVMDPNWECKVMDVEGASLQGKFGDGELHSGTGWMKQSILEMWY